MFRILQKASKLYMSSRGPRILKPPTPADMKYCRNVLLSTTMGIFHILGWVGGSIFKGGE